MNFGGKKTRFRSVTYDQVPNCSFGPLSSCSLLVQIWRLTRDNELFQTLFRTKKPSPFTILTNCEKYKILDDEMFKDGDDDLSDLTSSEQSQLNDWYDNLSSKYDKVGNIIREVSQ